MQRLRIGDVEPATDPASPALDLLTEPPPDLLPSRATPPRQLPGDVDAVPRPIEPEATAPHPQAAAVFADPIPAEGSLATLEPARLFGWAVATGYSGCLWLSPGAGSSAEVGLPDRKSLGPHREIYFERGIVQGVFSTCSGDGLLEVLTTSWSAPQLRRAQLLLQGVPLRQLRTQVNHLGRARLLDPKDAPVRLHTYLTELLMRALTPTVGRYRLLAKGLLPSERFHLPTPTRRLLVDGLRHTPLLRLQGHLGPPSTCLLPIAAVLPEHGGAVLHDTAMTLAEERALRLFDGRRTLAQVMEQAGLGEHATYVLAYALLCFGALAVPGALPIRTHTPQKVTKSTPTPDALSAALARVQAVFAKVECADYLSLLELPRHVSTAQVLQAHQRLSAELAPSAQPYRCRMAMDRELRQIAQALDEAAFVLADDTRRRMYVAALAPEA